MTVEQALYVLHLLADNYNKDDDHEPRQQSRDPDRQLHAQPRRRRVRPDVRRRHAPYCAWRKNRQPNCSGCQAGTDLNRNYGYKWACCGGSSGSTSSETYRGKAAWSATEVRVFRDFVNSRVKNGVQQIRAHITLHTNGQLILWPYGYTRTDLPDMTSLDFATFVTMGKTMASLNGYKAEQSSDLYITDGDQIDWMYGAHRIFSFTWELYPPETATVWGDHYPADENIAPQTVRNRKALLYFIDIAGCPYRAVGKEKTHCGTFYDDFEILRGWIANPYGTDTATIGYWVQKGAEATFIGGVVPMQLGQAFSGARGIVTVNGPWERQERQRRRRHHDDQVGADRIAVSSRVADLPLLLRPTIRGAPATTRSWSSSSRAGSRRRCSASTATRSTTGPAGSRPACR